MAGIVIWELVTSKNLAMLSTKVREEHPGAFANEDGS